MGKRKRISGQLTTVTIQGSWTSSNADGATALVLDTQEAGPIAFVLSLQVIEIIRRELATAEIALRRALGNA